VESWRNSVFSRKVAGRDTLVGTLTGCQTTAFMCRLLIFSR
jgi:hypothetical protein